MVVNYFGVNFTKFAHLLTLNYTTTKCVLVREVISLDFE
jgi:hypothetical protein